MNNDLNSQANLRRFHTNRGDFILAENLHRKYLKINKLENLFAHMFRQLYHCRRYNSNEF